MDFALRGSHMKCTIVPLGMGLYRNVAEGELFRIFKIFLFKKFQKLKFKIVNFFRAETYSLSMVGGGTKPNYCAQRTCQTRPKI